MSGPAEAPQEVREPVVVPGLPLELAQKLTVAPEPLLEQIMRLVPAASAAEGGTESNGEMPLVRDLPSVLDLLLQLDLALQM